MSEAAGSPDGGGTIECEGCGAQVADTERFCRSCGATLAGPDATRAVAVVADSAIAAAPDATTATPRVDARTASLTAAEVAEGRICPRCRTTNDPRRELCGSCGVDLDTGASLPRPLGAADAPAPNNGIESAHRRHLWMGFGAAVAVAVLIVAGLAIAGVGPFEREPSLPTAEFDPGWYGGEMGSLLLSDIATLTTRRPEGVDVFTPAQMVDLDPTTAWYNDGDALPDGIGEKIDLFLASPAWVHQIVVTNGDQSDPDAYADSARMHKVLVTFDGGVSYILNLLDLGLQRQVVELPEPVLTTTVRLEVQESFPGADGVNLAVSDLELHGWAADGPDVELADRRAALRRAAGPAELPDPLGEDPETQP